MPEGDTLHRTVASLRRHLVGQPIRKAHARRPGPAVERLAGSRVDAIEALGKHLLLRFSNGLVVRTHLGMGGSWHRYAPGEPWRRRAGRASLVLEVPGSVAVCFDASVVELFERRAERIHPILAALGPDLLGADFDPVVAVRRLGAPIRSGLPIAEALIDQGALAGIGNVLKSEVLFVGGVDPFTPVGRLEPGVVAAVVATARRLLMANRDAALRVTTDERHAAAGRRLWVYGRAGRPCLRCGAHILARRHGQRPRTTYWCPRCQPVPAADGKGATRAAPEVGAARAATSIGSPRHSSERGPRSSTPRPSSAKGEP